MDIKLRTIRTDQLERIGQALGLARHPGEDHDDFASRCHYVVDALMRDHAIERHDHHLPKLMNFHDAIEECFPAA